MRRQVVEEACLGEDDAGALSDALRRHKLHNEVRSIVSGSHSSRTLKSPPHREKLAESL